MRIVREVPLNPHVVVYHVDNALTTAIVEAYRDAERTPFPFGELVALGAESVHVTRYRFMVRKPRRWEMLEFLRTIEPTLCAWANCDAIFSAPEETERWRAFEVDFDPTQTGFREVYEGQQVAQKNPLAEDLFRLEGIAEVLLTPVRVTVGKGILFDWSALAPDVERSLAHHRAARKERGWTSSTH